MAVIGHLEPLSAVLRIGGAYGEPYTYAVPIRYLSPTLVEVLGAVRAPKPSEWRAVQHVLREGTYILDVYKSLVERPQLVYLNPAAGQVPHDAILIFSSHRSGL